MTTIVLIGMAAAGKTTVARALAALSGWAMVDTDALLEAWWGAPLQAIRDHLGLEGFLDAEAEGIMRLSMRRAIIATGGSVVYRENAMEHLVRQGWIVHVDASLATIAGRLHNVTSRGLAMRPGQTVAELYAERAPLYARWAQFRVCTDSLDPQAAAARIWEHFSTLTEHAS
ncbi:shikimate kinase [Thermodesulfomicrobium sp. WS]|uniref:homoserine kinase n=1 Tax=Thermodesulfomicrobium sp. WS TaxID=3004129 RepID=UPI002492AC4C|nr:homoserine kinase [Thermodesulfomicrobium sp. WS]BDV00661.1 shikimate kinase [Thermodesulfomicrobium sp. WS]